jgi:DNA (cytosine-5)-methyltransferase 1
VKNLLNDEGNTFAVIRHMLEEELGYSLHYRVLDGKAFVPQHRAHFHRGSKPREFFFPELPKQGRSSIDPRGHCACEVHVVRQALEYLQGYAEKHRAKGNGFGFGLVGRDDTSRTLSARYYKDGSEILIKQPRKNPRRLTPSECAKLMGFPDDFVIPVSDTRAYKQFGNSVVVPLVRVVACEILRALGYPVSEGAAPNGQKRSAEQLRVTLNA